MESQRQFVGKTALVTGAGRGIGRAIAEAFAQSGANLVIVARTKSELGEAAASCSRLGAGVMAETIDLAQPTQIDALFARIRAANLNIDVLVNNAAILIKSQLEAYQLADFQAMLAINVTAPMLLSQKALPMMKQRGGGAIVNISSLSGCFGVQKFPGFGAYDMTKYALWGLTEMLALENMQNNIRVNQLSLSGVDTQMMRSASPPGVKANLTAEHVAKHVLYLASDESEPLTGENIILTGMAPAR